MKKMKFIVLVVGILGLFNQNTNADFFEWTNGDLTNNLDVTANLTISGNNLTIVLANISTTPTSDPIYVLSSFYFDFVNANGDSVYPILQDNSVPSLSGTYLQSATGDLYRTVIGGADLSLGTNLLTTLEDPDYTNDTPPWWIAKDMDQSLYPLLGYGIGAVGNNYLTPNNFGSLDGDNGGIVQNGDIESANFTGGGNTPLVKDTATFVLTFNDLEGLSIGQVAFGFGSDPHDLHIVPVPGAVLIGIIGLGAVGIKLRKYA